MEEAIDCNFSRLENIFGVLRVCVSVVELGFILISMEFTNQLFKNHTVVFSLIVSKTEITERFYLESGFCPAYFIGDFGKLHT